MHLYCLLKHYFPHIFICKALGNIASILNLSNCYRVSKMIVEKLCVTKHIPISCCQLVPRKANGIWEEYCCRVIVDWLNVAYWDIMITQMPFQLLRAKGKFLPPHLGFAHLWNKEEKKEKGVLDKKRRHIQLLLEATEAFKEFLLYHKDPHVHKNLMTQQLQNAAFNKTKFHIHAGAEDLSFENLI